MDPCRQRPPCTRRPARTPRRRKKLARRKATNEEVALQLGVSVEFARWRMDSTGARIIAQRQAAAYRRAINS